MVYLTKDPVRINDAARPRICDEVWQNMQNEEWRVALRPWPTGMGLDTPLVRVAGPYCAS